MKKLLLFIVMLITIMGITTKSYGYKTLSGFVKIANGSTEIITEELIQEMVQYICNDIGIELVDDSDIYLQVYVNIFYSPAHDKYAGYVRNTFFYDAEIVPKKVKDIPLNGKKYVELFFNDTAMVTNTKENLKKIIFSSLLETLKDYKKMKSI